MASKKLTCIICPRGCSITVDGDTVTGNSCPKGKAYAIQETVNPVRTVTASVRVSNRRDTMVSVKTAAPIPKGEMFRLMDVIHGTSVEAPVKIGDVLILGVMGTDVVATKEIQ